MLSEDIRSGGDYPPGSNRTTAALRRSQVWAPPIHQRVRSSAAFDGNAAGSRVEGHELQVGGSTGSWERVGGWRGKVGGSLFQVGAPQLWVVEQELSDCWRTGAAPLASPPAG